jgi:circadian clock protein KaiC
VAKVLTYLQRFEFFDEEKVGSSIHYRDIGPQLAKEGISMLLPYLSDIIHEMAPKIIVIDSFKALHDLTESRSEMRRMLSALTGMLTAYETTVFLLGEYTDENARVMPEFAIADGIVQFMRSPSSSRDERFVRVLKLRGSAYLEGLHGCRITGKGLDIYPRLVTPEITKNYTWVQERVPSGVEGFDEMVGGGFLRGSITLLAGMTGSGKTTFALQFALKSLELNERSLYVHFQENPTQLARSIENLKPASNAIGTEGIFEEFYASPVELQIDSIVVQLFEMIEEKRIHRVVIDALGDLETAAADVERLRDYIYSLTQHLAVKGITTILVYETTDGIGKQGRLYSMADNIVVLGGPEPVNYERTIRCVKARGSEHDLNPHDFNIEGGKIKVQGINDMKNR